MTDAVVRVRDLSNGRGPDRRAQRLLEADRAGKSRIFRALYHIPRDVARRRISELLERLDLAGRADELVERYSSGMKQRVAIAKALLPSPVEITILVLAMAVMVPLGYGVFAVLERYCRARGTLGLH
jgi:ABC-type uncharacterized transport system ATPase subunit